MNQLEDFFSDEAIILRLCKNRIKQAATRHKGLFFRQISAAEKMPEFSEEPAILPPRRQWNRFRSRKEERAPDKDHNLDALYRATLTLRKATPDAPWVEGLNQKIRQIRQRALEDTSFAFTPPTVRAEEKEKDSGVYRAITQFTADDQIIEGITAKYLREVFDETFTDSSLAFRCARPGIPAPTHHDAITRIDSYRRCNQRAGLYVAECDIQGFYDCVSHRVALQSLLDLIAAASRRDCHFQIDQRALQLFQAYLACYTFPRNVKNDAEPCLKKKYGTKAVYKWPEEALREIHNDPQTGQIGIPQGGAISCFIANCVLHQADVAVKNSRSKATSAFLYLRYCDDMVILAPNLKTCEVAFSAYKTALHKLLLPIHTPSAVANYDKEFWAGKSREPYFWAKPLKTSTVPWIQFVGYQIRYDGMLRVRKKSIEKHKKQVLKETNHLLRLIAPASANTTDTAAAPLAVRKTPDQIIHRFKQKLIAMSVGRREVHHDLSEGMPKCWAIGFKIAQGKRIPMNAIRELDRFRERQIARVKSRLKKYPPAKQEQGPPDNIRLPRYQGFPFSYVGQFVGGRK
ncbi:MAG: reverse transcriptase domain-containing protein [Verrucomicrobiota bacterium]